MNLWMKWLAFDDRNTHDCVEKSFNCHKWKWKFDQLIAVYNNEVTQCREHLIMKKSDVGNFGVAIKKSSSPNDWVISSIGICNSECGWVYE